MDKEIPHAVRGEFKPVTNYISIFFNPKGRNLEFGEQWNRKLR